MDKLLNALGMIFLVLILGACFVGCFIAGYGTVFTLSHSLLLSASLGEPISTVLACVVALALGGSASGLCILVLVGIFSAIGAAFFNNE